MTIVYKYILLIALWKLYEKSFITFSVFLLEESISIINRKNTLKKILRGIYKTINNT